MLAQSSLVRIAAKSVSFADHNYIAEAEQAYQMATGICPSSPEAVYGYIDLLTAQEQFEEAISVAQNAVNAAPENQQFQALLSQLRQKQFGK
jgi:predicted Zn-dependent protease